MYDNQNDNNQTDNDIDLVDFSVNREMDKIRENERLEREARLKMAAALRKKELAKKKKMQRLRQTVTAWAIVAVALLAVVLIIITIAKGCDDDSEPAALEVGDNLNGNELSAINAFAESKLSVYGSANEKTLDEMLNVFVKQPQHDADMTSYLSMQTDAYMWNGYGSKEALKTVLRDAPIYNNGYVWSETDSFRYTKSGGFLYDTNASYVSAVCDVCLWEGNTSFLSEIDTTGEKASDISYGMSVGEKLDKAVSHYFKNANTGIEYNSQDKLVYILTPENNGGGEGKVSNIFFNHRFGYLDLYNNLLFNKAMSDLAKLYKISGDISKANEYKLIAKENKEAINQKFYDESLGRYVGCIDVNGNVHDGGFVALNLMAVNSGVAQGDRADSIVKWINGSRSIANDTANSKSILANPVMPVFTTVEASDSWWDYLGGGIPLSGDAKYGNYWQNGGSSAFAGQQNMLRLNKDELCKTITNMTTAYKNGTFSLGTNPDSDLNEPVLHYSAYVSSLVKKYFGISTDGNSLTLNPAFSRNTTAGIKNISFCNREYDVLFDKKNVYIMSNISAPVKINVGGFKAGQQVEIITVVGEAISEKVKASANDKGFVQISQKLGDGMVVKIAG